MPKFRLAKKKDDNALRNLMREITIPGWVTMAYLREPDYFLGTAVQGKNHDLLVAENEKGKIIASGTRCIRNLYIDETDKEVGYLCGLRSKKEGITDKTVFKGYGQLKKIHEKKSDTPFYLTTIIDDNRRAKRILTSNRPPLPIYEHFGDYISTAIPLNKFHRNPKNTNIRRLSNADLPILIEFLNREGRKKQFFPVIPEDFLKTASTLGLNIESFYAYFADGKLIGVAAVWDQSSFKQYLVCEYRKDIAVIKPFLNLLLQICGFRKLPAIKTNLKELYIAFPCVKENNPAILKDIVSTMLFDLRKGDFHFLCGGFYKNDPLLDALKSFKHFTYKSSIYLVYWEDGTAAAQKLDKTRIPYLEIGTL